MQDVKLFIGGEFITTDNTVPSIDPSNGETIANIHIPSESDINNAVDAAHNAFYNGPWKDFSKEQRSEILLKVSDLLKERKREFISWEIKDSGSTFSKAAADVHNAASFFKVMSKTVLKLDDEPTLDERATREGFSKNYLAKMPVGVCAQIIPWNFPLVMAAWKIGPILATGCTTVLKTAVETPMTAILLAEVLRDAGVPSGVVNIITGGAKEGQTLLNNKKIRKVAFTGSTAVGAEILKGAATRIQNTTMELGGKSANIILNDADLDIAVDGALYGFLYHQGQACDSGTRILVQSGIYDEFKTRLVERAKEINIGLTSEKDSGFGPLVSEKQLNTVMGYINKTKEEGATLLTGGKRLGGEYQQGFFVEPTIFEIDQKNTIWKEEIFGPVAGLTKFETIEEAIELANDSDYGLAGAVWGKNSEETNKVARAVETGTMWINEYHLLNPGLPFGGFKMSGIGREMGIQGINAYLEEKHIWVSDCDKREDKPWFNVLF